MKVDTYRIAGITITFEVADRHLRRLISDAWSAFRVASPRGVVHARFRFPDRAAGALPRLKRWHTLVTDHVLVVTDGRRYLVAGYMYDHPWHIECRSLPDWDPAFVYYYVCEPLLLDVLKRLGVLVWHGAAIQHRGRAVLLPALSGSGKSTTVLNLLQIGCRFIADDVVIVRDDKGGPVVTGVETGLYVTDKTRRLLPEWGSRVTRARVKKGSRWKRRIDLSAFRSSSRSPTRAAYLLFPQIGRGTRTRLEPLTEAQALVECLDQKPKEFPVSALGPAGLARQFEIYANLVHASKSYRLILGSDQQHVRDVLAQVLHAR